jgi:hypothetical protein
MTITLFSTDPQALLKNQLPSTAYSLVFSPDDKYIFYSNLTAIVRYDMASQEVTSLAASTDSTTFFTKVQLSPDYKTLYYRIFLSTLRLGQVMFFSL